MVEIFIIECLDVFFQFACKTKNQRWIDLRIYLLSVLLALTDLVLLTYPPSITCVLNTVVLLYHSQHRTCRAAFERCLEIYIRERHVGEAPRTQLLQGY